MDRVEANKAFDSIEVDARKNYLNAIKKGHKPKLPSNLTERKLFDKSFPFFESYFRYRQSLLSDLGCEAYSLFFLVSDYYFQDDSGAYKPGMEEKEEERMKAIDAYFTDNYSFNDVFIFADSIADKGFYDRDFETLIDLTSCCWKIAHKKEIHPEDTISFFMADWLATKLTDRAIGYWTRKLEEMDRAKKNVQKRTKTKEAHKTKLKEWMKSMKPKEYRRKAQEEFDVTERTILNYIKEIEQEKTAFLRKNTDTA